MNKEDPRVRSTILKFKEALGNLMLKEDDYYDISVKELCEEANLSRRTFYLHFASIDEVLLLIQEDIVDAFYDFAKSNNRDYRIDCRPLIAFFFDLLSNNPIYEKIFLKPINDHIRNVIAHSFATQNNKGDKTNLDNFTLNSVVTTYNNVVSGIYREWVVNKKSVPKEKAVNLTSRIINEGYKFIYSL